MIQYSGENDREGERGREEERGREREEEYKAEAIVPVT